MDITARLDAIADQIEQTHPELALKLDRISDYLDRRAGMKLPSKADAVKTLRETFKDNPKSFVNIFNKILDMMNRHKTKTAGNLWDTLKAVASPKVILSILALLIAVPKAQDIMSEVFSESPDTAIGSGYVDKAAIKKLTEKKSLSPKALKGAISGKYKKLIDDALESWSAVNGDWDFVEVPWQYNYYRTSVGAGCGTSRGEAKKQAYTNAYYALSTIGNEELDSFEKEEDGVWIAIYVMGVSDDLWDAIRTLNKEYDREWVKKMTEEWAS